MPISKIQSDSFASGVGGKVLQVSQTISTAHESISATAWAATNVEGSITPSSTSSEIQVQISGTIRAYNNSGVDGRGAWRIYRQIASGGYSQLATNQTTHRSYDYGSSGVLNDIPFFIQYLDSPNTTSLVSYKLYGYKESGPAIEVGPDGDDQQYVVLTEIAG